MGALANFRLGRLLSVVGMAAGTAVASVVLAAQAQAIGLPPPPQGSSFCFTETGGAPVCFPSGHPMLQSAGSPAPGSTFGVKFTTVIATPSGNLQTGGTTGSKLVSASVLGGTSPATGSGQFDMVFQASSGALSKWTSGTGVVNLGVSLQGGTTPSLTASNVGGTLVAAHASNGDLWLWASGNSVGAGFSADQGLAMAPGTSPDAIGLSSGGYVIAFQGANGDLWTTGTGGTTDWGLGMMADTSPSIAEMSSGVEIAFQANTGNLWIAGADGTGDEGLGMAAGTSPSIIPLFSHGGFEVAFQANSGHLWLAGNYGTGDTGEVMAPGTSPSLGTPGVNDLESAYQGTNGDLFVAGNLGAGDTGQAMAPGSSPVVVVG